MYYPYDIYICYHLLHRIIIDLVNADSNVVMTKKANLCHLNLSCFSFVACGYYQTCRLVISIHSQFVKIVTACWTRSLFRSMLEVTLYEDFLSLFVKVFNETGCVYKLVPFSFLLVTSFKCCYFLGKRRCETECICGKVMKSFHFNAYYTFCTLCSSIKR